MKDRKIMDSNTYSNGSNTQATDANFIEILTNRAISCIATHDLARQFATLTDEERAEVKGFFSYYSNHPYVHQGTEGNITCVVSGRSVRVDYFAKMQYQKNSQIALFILSKVDIKN
jgi:hypothetical protein